MCSPGRPRWSREAGRVLPTTVVMLSPGHLRKDGGGKGQGTGAGGGQVGDRIVEAAKTKEEYGG